MGNRDAGSSTQQTPCAHGKTFRVWSLVWGCANINQFPLNITAQDRRLYHQLNNHSCCSHVAVINLQQKAKKHFLWSAGQQLSSAPRQSGMSSSLCWASPNAGTTDEKEHRSAACHTNTAVHLHQWDLKLMCINITSLRRILTSLYLCFSNLCRILTSQAC